MKVEYVDTDVAEDQVKKGEKASLNIFPTALRTYVMVKGQ